MLSCTAPDEATRKSLMRFAPYLKIAVSPFEWLLLAPLR